MNRSISIKFILIIITLCLMQLISNFSYAVEPDEVLLRVRRHLRGRAADDKVAAGHTRASACSRQPASP